jgi:hypothetical protein
MQLCLEIVLGFGLVLPATLAVALGERRRLAIALCLALVAIGVLLIVAAPFEWLEGFLKEWHLLRPMEVAAGILGLAAWRWLGNRTLGTILAVCGSLIAAHAVRALGGWAL